MAARPVVSAALIAFAIGCSQPPPPAPKPDAAAVKAATMAFWAKWSAADTAGNVAALVGMISPNAAFDAAGMKHMMTRADFETAMKGAFKSMKVTSEVITPSADWADGDHYYEQGSFTESSVTGGKGKTEYGRYFAAFAKDSAGTLTLERGAFLTDSTPAMKMTKAPSKAATPTKAPAKAPTKKAPSKKS